MAGEGGRVVVAEKSYAGCALASSGGWLHLAWTGADTRINLVSSVDGRAFGGKQTLPARSSKVVREDSRSSFDDPWSSTMSSTSKTVPLSPALAASASFKISESNWNF